MELEKVVLCCKGPGLVGHPSLKDIEFLVSNREIEDCPLNIHNMRNTNDILGHLDIVRVIGKIMRRKSDQAGR